MTGPETRLVALIDECDATPTCLLHGRTKEAFAEVAAAVDAEPIPASLALPGINQAALIYATFYTDSAYAGDSTAIVKAVAAFEQGDPTELQRQFQDAVTFQGEFVAARQAILCIDHPIRGPVDWPDGGNDLSRQGRRARCIRTFFRCRPRNSGITVMTSAIPGQPDLIPSPRRSQPTAQARYFSSLPPAMSSPRSISLNASRRSDDHGDAAARRIRSARLVLARRPGAGPPVRHCSHRQLPRRSRATRHVDVLQNG